MIPCTDPTSQIGQLNYEVQNVKRGLSSKAECHEISSLKSTVDSLNHTIRELKLSFDSLSTEFEMVREGLKIAAGL